MLPSMVDSFYYYEIIMLLLQGINLILVNIIYCQHYIMHLEIDTTHQSVCY